MNRYQVPMEKYIDLDMPTLVDLLVSYIKEYDAMLSSKVFSVEEFTQCKQRLAELHAAIKERGIREGYRMDNIFPNYPDNPHRIK